VGKKKTAQKDDETLAGWVWNNLVNLALKPTFLAI
tara:strand:- start:743 stop:847 length:105 start_codon:yes stop_codon:yes gene_type:complete